MFKRDVTSKPANDQSPNHQSSTTKLKSLFTRKQHTLYMVLFITFKLSVVNSIMLPKHIYQSACLIYRSSLISLHQGKSQTTLKTRVELLPSIVTDGRGIRYNSWQCRWFTSTSVEDDDTTSSSSNGNRSNAFRLFSLPLSFKIDETLLRTKYHDYMKIMHPDKQNSASDSNNDDDMDDVSVVASITNAYNVLKRPHLRAMHLLKILKYETNEQGTHHDDSDDQSKHLTEPSKEFLLEVMELQELIHGLKTDELLKPYFVQNRQRIHDTCEQLQAAFVAGNIKEFEKLAIALKYWTRIDTTLRRKLTSLE